MQYEYRKKEDQDQTGNSCWEQLKTFSHVHDIKESLTSIRKESRNGLEAFFKVIKFLIAQSRLSEAQYENKNRNFFR